MQSDYLPVPHSYNILLSKYMALSTDNSPYERDAKWDKKSVEKKWRTLL